MGIVKHKCPECGKVNLSNREYHTGTEWFCSCGAPYEWRRYVLQPTIAERESYDLYLSSAITGFMSHMEREDFNNSHYHVRIVDVASKIAEEAMRRKYEEGK